jgi:hypothetical protein
MGIFYPYIPVEGVRLIGVEAAGDGVDTGPSFRIADRRRAGVLHGNRTYLLQDEDGQIIETHSISAGLDYPGVGPEHAWLKDIGRAEYVRYHRCRSAQGLSTTCAASKASSRRWSPATRWPMPPSWRRRWPRTRFCWSTSPAGVTRTCIPWPKNPGSSSDVAHQIKLFSEASESYQAEGRKALIPFITAGDPDAALTVPLMHTLVEAGADIIELGVPFSDPMADGPTIQRASERALAKGMTCARCWNWSSPSARPTGNAGRADGLRQPDRGDGPREIRRRRRAGRRRWRAGRRLPAGRSAAFGAR